MRTDFLIVGAGPAGHACGPSPNRRSAFLELGISSDTALEIAQDHGEFVVVSTEYYGTPNPFREATSPKASVGIRGRMSARKLPSPAEGIRLTPW